MESIWHKAVQLPHFEALTKDLSTDVLVVGGGIAGLLCAYRLQQAGIDYALVEAASICSGITQNTTAKLTAQHGLIYHKLMDKLGPERAQLYLDAHLAALDDYRQICQDIPCDFEEKDHFVYALDDRHRLEQEISALETLRAPATFCSNLPLPMETVGAVKFSRQAQYHPLKFLGQLATRLRIYENTPVRELAPGAAKTDHGSIRAKKIVIATHFPFLNKHGSYFLKMYQHRSYALALDQVPIPDGMYLDNKQTGLSFRSWGDHLILGGGSHRTGKQGGNWTELEAFAHKYYPEHRIRARWATQDCMTLDGMPYIGQYAAATRDLYVATGFNKWGMTGAMAAANILTDLIQGKDNPYTDLFSPSRSMLHPQLAVNAFEAMSNLLRLTPKRCPHMGCGLQWNPQEHSWDCPCHGSRFEENGKLIDNPATNDLKT